MFRKLSASVLTIVMALFGSPSGVLAGDPVVASAPSDPIAADTPGTPGPQVQQQQVAVQAQVNWMSLVEQAVQQTMPPTGTETKPVLAAAFPGPGRRLTVTPARTYVDGGRTFNCSLTGQGGAVRFGVTIDPDSNQLKTVAPGNVTVTSITAGTTNLALNARLTLTQLRPTSAGAPSWTVTASGGRDADDVPVIHLYNGQTLVADVYMNGTIRFRVRVLASSDDGSGGAIATAGAGTPATTPDTVKSLYFRTGLSQPMAGPPVGSATVTAAAAAGNNPEIASSDMLGAIVSLLHQDLWVAIKKFFGTEYANIGIAVAIAPYVDLVRDLWDLFAGRLLPLLPLILGTPSTSVPSTTPSSGPGSLDRSFSIFDQYIRP